MSYQPLSPTAPLPGGQQGRGSRKPALIAVGALLLVAGIVAAVMLVMKSSSSVEDNVKKLARAPSGCQTTLDFDKTGTFYVFYERSGRVGDLEGGCSGIGGSYDRSDDAPSEQPTLEDDNGDAVDLDDRNGPSYDEDGFAGTALYEFDVEDSGLYRLTVPESDEGFAYAIGPDPARDKNALLGGGIAAGVGGIVIGGLLLLLGMRRRQIAPARAATAPVWQPQPGSGSSAPWGASTPAPYNPPAYQPPSYQPPAHHPPPPPSHAPSPWQQPASAPRPPVWGEPGLRGEPTPPPSQDAPTEQMPARPSQPFAPPTPPSPPRSHDDER